MKNLTSKSSLKSIQHRNIFLTLLFLLYYFTMNTINFSKKPMISLVKNSSNMNLLGTFPIIFYSLPKVTPWVFEARFSNPLANNGKQGSSERKRQIEWWTCGSVTAWKKGDAVWKTPTHPSTIESKEPSSSKSALNKWSLSFAPSRESKCSVFLGSSVRN